MNFKLKTRYRFLLPSLAFFLLGISSASATSQSLCFDPLLYANDGLAVQATSIFKQRIKMATDYSLNICWKIQNAAEYEEAYVATQVDSGGSFSITTTVDDVFCYFPLADQWNVSYNGYATTDFDNILDKMFMSNTSGCFETTHSTEAANIITNAPFPEGFAMDESPALTSDYSLCFENSLYGWDGIYQSAVSLLKDRIDLAIAKNDRICWHLENDAEYAEASVALSLDPSGAFIIYSTSNDVLCFNTVPNQYDTTWQTYATTNLYSMLDDMQSANISGCFETSHSTEVDDIVSNSPYANAFSEI